MKEFAKNKINFSIIRVDNSVDKMIKVMRDNYDSEDLKLNVSDLQESVAKKTDAEVTKEFVTAASFILNAAVAGKKINKTDPLWDPKKFEVGQWFS